MCQDALPQTSEEPGILEQATELLSQFFGGLFSADSNPSENIEPVTVTVDTSDLSYKLSPELQEIKKQTIKNELNRSIALQVKVNVCAESYLDRYEQIRQVLHTGGASADMIGKINSYEEFFETHNIPYTPIVSDGVLSPKDPLRVGMKPVDTLPPLGKEEDFLCYDTPTFSRLESKTLKS